MRVCVCVRHIGEGPGPVRLSAQDQLQEGYLVCIQDLWLTSSWSGAAGPEMPTAGESELLNRVTENRYLRNLHCVCRYVWLCTGGYFPLFGFFFLLLLSQRGKQEEAVGAVCVST